MADTQPVSVPAPAPEAVTEAVAAPPAAAAAAATEHTVKRKVCIYFGYVGERYSGLQYVKEPHINTVEREVLSAVHRGGYLSDANFHSDGPLQKVGWERASRTDKGVHALKNLISAKLQFPPAVDIDQDYTEHVARLNSLLPADIRVYKIQPVTGSFNAYMFCHGRRYQYYLPTFALCSKEEYDAMLPHDVAPQHIVGEEVFAEERAVAAATATATAGDAEGSANAETEADGTATGEKRPREEDAEEGAKEAPTSSTAEATSHRRRNNDIKYGSEPMNVFQTIPEAYMRRLAEYRISPANLERARRLFGMYVGTKPYHNFTPGGKPSDKSTIRYIQRVTVNDPEVLVPALPQGEEDAAKAAHLSARYPAGLEWVRIELEGQSFMLNQIRKMIGNVVCAMALGLPDYFVSDCLQTNVIRGIPMAPANGLFLSYLNFDIYNKRLEKMKEQHNKTLGRRMEVDMDFEEGEINPAEKAAFPEAYERLVAEKERTQAQVKAMHAQILATVGRRECVEDITGRWMRSCRHVSRLCFKMEFGPDDDPQRYEKAPDEISARTAPKINHRTEAAPAAPVADADPATVPATEAT